MKKSFSTAKPAHSGLENVLYTQYIFFMEEFYSILILMVTIWVAGKLFRAVKLPVIFGELVGGIIVGPMVLGLIDPGSHTVALLAELGIFFLMIHAGLEADPYELFHASKKSILIALGGIAVPFAAGFLVATAFGQELIPSLYIALCLSVTAIAISARLFKDYKIQRSKAAHITMGAAIIDDILALVLFSVIFSLFEQGEIMLVPILILLLKILLFFGVVILGGHYLSRHMGKILKKNGFTFALIVALTLGLIAESIGLHMILGAFLAGLFIREEVLDENVFQKIEDRIYGLSYGFLGPIFFASLAFHLDFTAVFTTPLFLAAVLIAAILGKLLGSGLTALVQKVKLKDAIIIGLAMNSRGAVELILASIGYEKGLIDQDVLSILIIMGFVTTLLTIFAMRPVAKQVAKL